MGFVGKIAKVLGSIVLGIIGIAVVAAVAGGGKSSTTSTPAQSAAAAPAPARGAAANPAPPANAAPANTAQTAKPAPTAVVLPAVGADAQTKDWKIAFQKMETATQLGKTDFSPGTDAQGKFVVLTLAATNLHNETSNLNSWDFDLKSAEGITYKTSSEGSSALIFDTKSGSVKPLSLGEQIQPGLTKPFRLVFDVNPSVSSYTLEAAGSKFVVNLP